jgi:class 3 adenylate cyclase/tetratricopeptide (TPR) repeat protein
MTAAPVTLLFTDLVESTGLLQRVGDERALRILQAHHRLLRDAVAIHGGREVKWTGDGLMTTFASSADAVRCAVTMQQTTRARAAGERLAMRAGLHVGEVLPDEADFVGAAVVVARRLCDRASAGQILCSRLVAELLGGRRAFRFGEVGALELKGLAAPVTAYEVHYDRDDPAAMLRHTPFTGRVAELTRLERRLGEACGSRGGVAMLVGEPGIGKTRTLEEFAETARGQEALVLWGRCYEGEAAQPYGPFAEAIAEYARKADAATLWADLGPGAAPLARLVPAIKERLPDLAEPVPLNPDEERTRLIDAMTQFLLAIAVRTSTVLVLDDLHWADAGTVALLRHVARFAPHGRLLLVGAYRDVEVGREHPLADVLGVLPRETAYDQVALAGLEAAAVHELLESVADQEVAQRLVATITRETSGNPFFIRAVLLHLLEEGVLTRDGASWSVSRLDRIGLPKTVRQVIERRIGRVSEPATQLLRAAAVFTGGIDFEVARWVAGLDEMAALDALDETLSAQLLVGTADPRIYDFTHALVRHTLYEALSPARQTRLHRQIAEAIQELYGDRAPEHAAEIARHYHRSATLPGAKCGVPWCLEAAKQAEWAAALTEVVEHLRAALDLFGNSDPQRPRLLARLGLALSWTMRFDDAVAVARDAASKIAEAETRDAAADYLAETLAALGESGGVFHVFPLVEDGLEYVGKRRDWTWAIIKAYEIHWREIHDPMGAASWLDTPERREAASLLAKHGWRGIIWNFAAYSRRAEQMAADGLPNFYFGAGDYRGSVSKTRELAADAERRGRLCPAVPLWANAARLHIALGDFADAEEARRRAASIAGRLTEPSSGLGLLIAVQDDWRLATDEGWDAPIEQAGPGLGDERARAWYWGSGGTLAAIARGLARMGRVESAMQFLESVQLALERLPAWADTYTRLACDAAETLWFTEQTNHIAAIERNVRTKVIEPDFRYPMMDGRLAVARLCALQQRWDEAVDWFAQARTVLEEQGARPLRAIVDYDEALMYARRGAAGDRERARPLVTAALRQFRTLGMPGWIRRAEALLKSGAAGRQESEGALR